MRRWASGLVGVVVVLGAMALGACGDDDEDATSPDTGTIKLVVEDWAGVEGYRLLAGVWTEADPRELVGAVFWTIIDSDPWSGEDVVHPPYDGEGEPAGTGDGWGAGDYLWDETASLEPGTYRIDLWANPGELAPYGSHLPADPIERGCAVEVEVTAGKTSTVVISDIPSLEGMWQQDLCQAGSWNTE